MDARDESSLSYRSRTFVEHSSSTSSLKEDSEPITRNLASGVTIENVEEEEDNILRNTHPLESISSGEILTDRNPRREDCDPARSRCPAYCQPRDQMQAAPNNGICQGMTAEQYYTQQSEMSSKMTRRMMPGSTPGRARCTNPAMMPRTVPDVMKVMEVDTRMGYRNPYDCSGYQVAQLPQQDSMTPEEYMQWHQIAPQMFPSLDSGQVRLQPEPPEQQQTQQNRNYSGEDYFRGDANSEVAADDSSDQSLRSSFNGMSQVIPPTQEASWWSVPQPPCTCGCSGCGTNVNGPLGIMPSMPQTCLPNCMAAAPQPCYPLSSPPCLCVSSGIGQATQPGMVSNTCAQVGNQVMDPIQNHSVYSMDYKPINICGNVFNHFPNRGLTYECFSSCKSGKGPTAPTYMIPPVCMPPCVYGYTGPVPMACPPQPGAPFVPGYAGCGSAPPEPLPQVMPQTAGPAQSVIQ